MTGAGASSSDSGLRELLGDGAGLDARAAERLFAGLYHELHRLAEHHLRRSDDLTLSATTLLHEAYLNISGREELSFDSRARFFAYASRAMRGLVIDYARRKRARRRGTDFEITLAGEDLPMPAPASAGDLEHLGEALDDLAGLSPQLAELVDLHFFCGFTFAEIAGLRGVSDRTVQRDWRKARILLHHQLGNGGPGSD